MSESAEQTARHNKKSSSFDQIALYSGIKEGEVPLEIPVRPCENLSLWILLRAHASPTVEAGLRAAKNRDDFTRPRIHVEMTTLRPTSA
jgi:hypothetical protein